MTQNPFFENWTTPFSLPPFGQIRPEHFEPAFEAALAQNRAEIAEIETNPAPAGFDNTIAALESSGQALERVGSVFWNLVGADSSEALERIEMTMSPVLARHYSEIHLNEGLFRRIDAVFAARTALSLDEEQMRVLELTHSNFILAGARLHGASKLRLGAIMERLAILGASFSQNVLADEKAYALVLKQEAELSGLPTFLRSAMANAAAERGFPGAYAVTLSRSIIEPFLQFSSRRDLREAAFKAWTERGQHEGPHNNLPIIAEMVELRAERAALLGFPSFAAYKLSDQMAKSPAAARSLLENVWSRARAKAERERDELQALAQAEGDNIAIRPHDWRYYSEKLRRQKHDLDETEFKPYLKLDSIIEAAFYTAHRLFGLTFAPLFDVPVYHEDVRVWQVKGRDGADIGLFLGDYYNRSSKRSGAWMSAFRAQRKLGGDVRPIIVNVMNFAPPAKDSPTLLSFDDARTLFHEFGHALHGLLSNVTYPLVSGTSVARDFVEFPSQLFEHWFMQKQVLRKFALHAETGEPIPEALLDKLIAARNFNQGFLTVEYTSCALVDLDFHALAPNEAKSVDPLAFERAALDEIGMPAEIVMRHRTPHFSHIFSGDGYSAGYYSYLWSEVLDADGFKAFEEKKDIFDPETAKRLLDYVYAAGNSKDPAAAYIAFRGRLPQIDALLEKRGLV